MNRRGLVWPESVSFEVTSNQQNFCITKLLITFFDYRYYPYGCISDYHAYKW